MYDNSKNEKIHYALWKVCTQMKPAVMETIVTCKCGHETSRSKCKVETSENEFMTYRDYYCDACDEWIRTDSVAKPLPEKVKKVKKEEDSEDE
jgi:hypothetical protein